MVFQWSLINRKSPGFFSVFWPVVTVLSFGWSRLVFLFPILPVPLSILWWLYRMHWLLLVSPSLSCSIVFSVLFQGPCTYLFRLLPVLLQNGKVHSSVIFFFFKLSLGLVVWLRFADPFVSWNTREFCAFHSPRWILGCEYTISNCQIQISCTVLSGSSSSPSRVYSYTLFALICCIRFILIPLIISYYCYHYHFFKITNLFQIYLYSGI